MNVADLRAVQARLGGLRRDELAAVSFAVVDVLRPFAELGGAETAYPLDIARLVDRAAAAMRSQCMDASRALLAEVEAIPVVAASEEPAGTAAFAMDVLACLIYAIKAMTEPEPALWSGYCLQRAYDCLSFADDVVGRSGTAARLMRAVDAWLDGDGGQLLRRESVSLEALPEQLRSLC